MDDRGIIEAACDIRAGQVCCESSGLVVPCVNGAMPPESVVGTATRDMKKNTAIHVGWHESAEMRPEILAPERIQANEFVAVVDRGLRSVDRQSIAPKLLVGRAMRNIEAGESVRLCPPDVIPERRR